MALGIQELSSNSFVPSLILNMSLVFPIIPQGQGLAERAHHTLKHMLQLLAEVTDTYSPLTPRNRLNHALFVLNFLSLDNEGRSAANCLWHPKSRDFSRTTVMERSPYWTM